MRRVLKKQVLGVQHINVNAPDGYEKKGALYCVQCNPNPNIGCFDAKLITRKMIEKSKKECVCDICGRPLTAIRLDYDKSYGKESKLTKVQKQQTREEVQTHDIKS